MTEEERMLYKRMRETEAAEVLLTAFSEVCSTLCLGYLTLLKCLFIPQEEVLSMISLASEVIREVEVSVVSVSLPCTQPTISRERYSQGSEHCYGALGHPGGTLCWKLCRGRFHLLKYFVFNLPMFSAFR